MDICYSATVLQFVFALLTPNIVYRNRQPLIITFEHESHESNELMF